MATLEQVIRALEEPRPLLELVGTIASDYARAAFRKQAFGSMGWLPRYPGQKGAKINVAGVVADLAAGKRPAGRRFEARPAGIDTGALRDSIGFDVRGDNEVVIGVSPDMRERAERVQFGGETRQPLTTSLKKDLARWAKSARGKPYAEKLAPLQQLDELVTELVPRRFIGMTPELAREINEALIEEVERL